MGLELRAPMENYVTEAHDFAVGLDLGQTNDPTAIAVIERITEGSGEWKITPAKVRTEIPLVFFQLRHLERLPLGMTYPAQVEAVKGMLTRPPLIGARLVVDQTGVGRPVVDLFRDGRLELTAVTITAGDAETREGDDHRVAKIQLISRLEAAMHAGTLKAAAALSEGKALEAELKDFRRNITAAGRATFAARVGKHDDLVLATADRKSVV